MSEHNKKEVFLDFISRYHLDGKIDRSVINFKEDSIRTESFNGGEQIYCTIEMKTNNVIDDDIKMTITDTSSLVRMLKPFEDPKISVFYNETNMNDMYAHSLVFEEDNIKSNFLLAVDGTVNPHGKEFNMDIDCKFEFDITKEFADKFNKYKFLLKDESRSFSFFERDNSVHVLFGVNRAYGSNNVAIDMHLEPKYDFRNEIIFPIDVFNSIIKNNNDANIHVKVLDRAMVVSCISDDFENIYALASLKNKE